ncbi:class I SAM-dependent methyltransferase [Thermostaphylospora chromogena]|nr:class I SAM-dependent methyltransferase [Thermostaphylospora chromogena]
MATMSSIAGYWDAAARRFDRGADHGLREPRGRTAWAHRLRAWLPEAPADVLDLGCGTGSLTRLLVEQGHRPLGIDLSPKMIAHARARLAGTGAEVVIGDAGKPPVGRRKFDAVLARHLLWTQPEPQAALRRWARLARRGGRLVLIEGRWNAPPGAVPYAERAEATPWAHGVEPAVLREALTGLVSDLRIEPLDDPALWGWETDDERYAVIATV